MTKTRESTERQLDHAVQAVKAREGILQEKGVEADKFKRDTIWRNRRSQARKIRVRLSRIGEIEAREKDMEVRRAAKTAAVEAE